jgi:uncharacterized protein
MMRNFFFLLILILFSLGIKAIKPLKEYIMTPDTANINYSEGYAVSSTDSIYYWHYKPKEIVTHKNKVVILSYGDYGNMSYWVYHATLICQLGYDVITYDYSGFGKSSQFSINTSHLFEPKFIDNLEQISIKTKQWCPRMEIVYYGLSMGSIISIEALKRVHKSLNISRFISEGLVINPCGYIESLKKDAKNVVYPKSNGKCENYLKVLKKMNINSLVFIGNKDSRINEFLDTTIVKQSNFEIKNYDGEHLQGLSTMTNDFFGDLYLTYFYEFLEK